MFYLLFVFGALRARILSANYDFKEVVLSILIIKCLEWSNVSNGVHQSEVCRVYICDVFLDVRSCVSLAPSRLSTVIIVIPFCLG